VFITGAQQHGLVMVVEPAVGDGHEVGAVFEVQQAVMPVGPLSVETHRRLAVWEPAIGKTHMVDPEVV
jgi:hypothetical protein